MTKKPKDRSTSERNNATNANGRDTATKPEARKPGEKTVCCKPFDPETARAHDIDDPCSNGES